MSVAAAGDTRKVQSACYMCTANCGITVESRGADIVHIHHPDCVRASAMLEQRESERRLLRPMIRGARGEDWQPASWDGAVAHTAAALRRIRDEHGPRSVAFVIGYTKEVRPYLQRLAYLFGSPQYATESSCCFAAGYVAAAVTLGEEYGYFLGPSRAHSGKTRCRLVWSNNPEASQLPYKDHPLLLEDRPYPLIVVDPRRTSLAKQAKFHLQPRPGTDGALALGLAHVLVAEGFEDKAFLEKHALGLDEFKTYLKQFPPERTAGITGVPARNIVGAAYMFGLSKPAQITISPNATTHHSNGFQAHRAILLLAALTGNLDVEGGNRPWGYRLQENSIALHADTLPGLRADGPELGGAEFPLFVNHYPEAQGMVLAEAIERGDIKAVVSVGMNLMMWPNSSRLEKALRGLELFTVSDFYPSPTLDAANVFFPAATHLEREALIVAGAGTVRYRPAAVPPRGEAKGDMDLVFDLAKALGLNEDFWNGDAHASFDERLQGSGLRFDELPKDGATVVVEVPVPAERGYEREGFGTPSGKVEFASGAMAKAGLPALPEYVEPFWSPVSRPDLAKDYPLVLTSGGRSNNFTHSQGRHLKTLVDREPDPRVELHVDDAVKRGIHHGDWVDVSSPLGSIRMRAALTEDILPGVAHAFHGWASANVNELIPDEGLDPISGFPPFKSSLCEIRKAE